MILRLRVWVCGKLWWSSCLCGYIVHFTCVKVGVVRKGGGGGCSRHYGGNLWIDSRMITRKITFRIVGAFTCLDSGVRSSGKRSAGDLRGFVCRSSQVLQARNPMPQAIF